MARTSVLINNYNNATFLKECVESALNQTRPADEVIVYDDGSTDQSVAILRTFGARIVLVEGTRTSLPSRASQANAVYQAFLRSTGQLIFLLDGDDRFQPAKIAEYETVFQACPQAVLIQAPLQQIDAAGSPLGSTYHALKHHDDYLEATYRLNDADFYYPTTALAFSRAFLEAVLPLDFSDGIELPIDTRLCMIAPLFGKVLSLNTPLSDWRRHRQSYTAAQASRRSTQLHETRKRNRVFNNFCKARGFRPIRLWRNHRFYLQLLRAVTPDFLFALYYARFHPSLSSTPSRTPRVL